jgi:hypothetical protein
MYQGHQGDNRRQPLVAVGVGRAGGSAGRQQPSPSREVGWGRSGRLARSAWRRSGRLVRWPASRWARSARRMITHARVVGWRAWLSLYSSTTTLAPKAAYCSSRRTHSCSSAGDRSRAGRAPGVERDKHRVQGGRGRLAGAPATRGGGALADGLGAAGRHAQAVADERLAQRRPGRTQFGRGSVDTAQPLGQLEGAFGFGAVARERGPESTGEFMASQCRLYATKRGERPRNLAVWEVCHVTPQCSSSRRR